MIERDGSRLTIAKAAAKSAILAVSFVDYVGIGKFALLFGLVDMLRFLCLHLPFCCSVTFGIVARYHQIPGKRKHLYHMSPRLFSCKFFASTS